MNSVKLDIYPAIEEAETLLETYTPVQANKFLPEWYKKHSTPHRGDESYSNIEGLTDRVITTKKCPAIQETVNTGVIIPAWTDIYIEKKGDIYNWYAHWKGAVDTIESHNIKQVEGMGLNGIKDWGVLKIMCPYLFITEPGYGLQFFDPFYHHRRTIRLLPGMVENDIWHQTHFPFEFTSNLDEIENKLMFIKAGEPLIQVVPYAINKNKINLSVNKYDENIYKKNLSSHVVLDTVSSSWQDYKKIKRKD